jgi:hypothetical protein
VLYIKVRCDYKKSAELSERADALEDVIGNDGRSSTTPRLLLEQVPQIDATREDVSEPIWDSCGLVH